MNFDYTVRHSQIDYALLRGNHQVVFIKPGLGTDYMGYENKYLRMAHRLRDGCGCSVVVASNPNNGGSHAESDREILEQYLADNGITTPELYFFGSSNGGMKGLELTDHGIVFRKMVLVNMPLMINFHKTKRYISRIPQTEILTVYGERDPSFSYLPFLKGRYENLRVITVPGADHNFKGMLDEFIGLSDFLLD